MPPPVHALKSLAAVMTVFITVAVVFVFFVIWPLSLVSEKVEAFEDSRL